jgi:HEAT repeat protein
MVSQCESAKVRVVQQCPLNRTRAAEEASGLIRWLRPEYQNPAGHAAIAQGTQAELDVGPTDTTTKTPWPKTLPDQIAAVHAALSDMGEATTDQIARRFTRAQSRSVQTLLESLTALGQARVIEGGRFAA